jgi:hypothetical protein
LHDAYANGGWNGYLRYVTEKSRTEKTFREIDAPSRTDGYRKAFTVAYPLALLGEKDEAFAWLEKAYQQREYELTLLRVSPEMDNLRSDPRFADLLRRVGLAQ